MTEQSAGDTAQTRIIVDQAAKAAVTKVLFEHPELRRPEIPAPLKWAGAIVAALFTMGVGAMAVWLVASVSSMQVTLARMDERMANQTGAQDRRYDDLDRRVERLEADQQRGGT